MRAKLGVLVVTLFLLALASAAMASVDDAWQLRLGVNAADGTNAAVGLDYRAVDHPCWVINHFSADYADMDGSLWMVNLGHRWVHNRTGYGLGVGPNWINGDVEVGGRLFMEYDVSDRWALSASYYKNGWQARGPEGHGFMFQLGYSR